MHQELKKYFNKCRELVNKILSTSEEPMNILLSQRFQFIEAGERLIYGREYTGHLGKKAESAAFISIFLSTK